MPQLTARNFAYLDDPLLPASYADDRPDRRQQQDRRGRRLSPRPGDRDDDMLDFASPFADDLCANCAGPTTGGLLYCSDACRDDDRRKSLAYASGSPDVRDGDDDDHRRRRHHDDGLPVDLRYPCPPSPAVLASLPSAAFVGADGQPIPSSSRAKLALTSPALHAHDRKLATPNVLPTKTRTSKTPRSSSRSTFSSLSDVEDDDDDDDESSPYSSASFTNVTDSAPSPATYSYSHTSREEEDDGDDDAGLDDEQFKLPPAVSPLVSGAGPAVEERKEKKKQQQPNTARPSPWKSPSLSFARRPSTTNLPAPIRSALSTVFRRTSATAHRDRSSPTLTAHPGSVSPVLARSVGSAVTARNARVEGRHSSDDAPRRHDASMRRRTMDALPSGTGLVGAEGGDLSESSTPTPTDDRTLPVTSTMPMPSPSPSPSRLLLGRSFTAAPSSEVSSVSVCHRPSCPGFGAGPGPLLSPESLKTLAEADAARQRTPTTRSSHRHNHSSVAVFPFHHDYRPVVAPAPAPASSSPLDTAAVSPHERERSRGRGREERRAPAPVPSATPMPSSPSTPPRGRSRARGTSGKRTASPLPGHVAGSRSRERSGVVVVPIGMAIGRRGLEGEGAEDARGRGRMARDGAVVV